MKKVIKFVKGKKDEKKESLGLTLSQSGDLISPAQTPEDEGFSGLDGSSGYVVDFGGRDKSLTKLHKAAWQGNLEKLKTSLRKVEVDAVDRRNRTALHLAVARGHPNIVWFLLGNNAKTSTPDDEGRTPLLKAIECGHKDCTTLLLDRGADVNASDYAGNTGLHVAVGRASQDTSSALLKKGADTEIGNNAGDYPLHVATKLENKDLVVLLLDAGASVDVPDRENRTPLMLAAKTGNFSLARIFVERGAQLSAVDSNGWTALDYAMLGGHENVSGALKSFLKSGEKRTEQNGKEDSDVDLNDGLESWNDSQTETSEGEPITRKLKKMFEECSGEAEGSGDQEKKEELPESPDADAIPPYCQPPRSWEMIQAGMIDENENKNEVKRRSITTLGTLHSRRESFTEGSTSSPQFTLSLNRRKGVKGSNAFAKQRFSFNEEEVINRWMNPEEATRKDLEKKEVENMLTLEEHIRSREPSRNGSEKERSGAGSDWDSASEERSENFENRKDGKTNSVGRDAVSCRSSDSGTLGRVGTMREVEEIWTSCPLSSAARMTEESQRSSWDSEDSSAEKGVFPPPPTALELGIDMARSIKYMKGMSVDQPPGCEPDRNLWKNVHERHSLDCLEEREFADLFKGTSAKIEGECASPQKGEEIFRCQKPRDRSVEVSRRINRELECYDQALRELAESSGRSEKYPPQNYYSLPSIKTGSGGECRRASSQQLTSDTSGGPHSLPLITGRCGLLNREEPDSEGPRERRSAESPLSEKTGEKSKRKSRRHMLLAMRDVKHAVHVANSFKTSMDDQILSPLAKPEDGSDSGEEACSKRLSRNSRGDSPPEENPFFGIGRQETVLERNGTGRRSSSSGTGEESTLWLQDDTRRIGSRGPESDDEVSEMAADEKWKHGRVSSFSPLGLIQKEMEEESQGTKSSAPRTAVERTPSPSDGVIRGDIEERCEEVLREQSPDVSLSSGPIEPIGVEKDSGSEAESSHNEVSPTHQYAFKNQRDWLERHLKATTSEKNKLEELTARLTEKAERLQYELADAKEAAKSRDEVIRLLQGQLAKMEAAYTKSLEESVQSRLQLTSREQEVLHLKELCFRYEEEKETETGAEFGFAEELKSKIKILEGERERMRERINDLEEVKSSLEKRLEQEKKEGGEMVGECQRWKERCRRSEEKATAFDSEEAGCESCATGKGQEKLRKQNFRLKKKILELGDENVHLKGRIQSLSVELEVERKKADETNEKDLSIFQMKRKTFDVEVQLKKLESEMEENRAKEAEKATGGEIEEFDRGRNSFAGCYEMEVTERTRGLKEVVEKLKDEMLLEQKRVSASVESAQETLRKELGRLKDEWNSVSKSIAEGQRNSREVNAAETTEKSRGGVDEQREAGNGKLRKFSGVDIENEISQLKMEVNCLRKLLDDEGWPATIPDKLKSSEKSEEDKPDKKKRGSGKEDEWSSLYGMKSMGEGRRRSTYFEVRSALVGVSDEAEKRKPSGARALNELRATPGRKEGQKCEKLEFLELKKEILSLQSRMLDEKNLRHALENQMIKMNLDLSQKDNLEKEINNLKRKMERSFLRTSEIELVQYQKDLEGKREKYLGESKGKGADCDYRAKCEVLAKEREKAKEIRRGNSIGGKAEGFDFSPLEGSPRLKGHSGPRPPPELLVQMRSVTLDPDTMDKLERKLDKSIKKYVQSESKRQR